MKKYVTRILLCSCLMMMLISSCKSLNNTNPDVVDVKDRGSVLLMMLMTRGDFESPSLSLSNAVITQDEEVLQSNHIELAAYGINGEYIAHNKSYYVNFMHRLWRFQSSISGDFIKQYLLDISGAIETSPLETSLKYSNIYSECATFKISKFKQCNVVVQYKKNIVSIFEVDISKDIENQVISDLINPVLSKIATRVDQYENSVP